MTCTLQLDGLPFESLRITCPDALGLPKKIWLLYEVNQFHPPSPSKPGIDGEEYSLRYDLISIESTSDGVVGVYRVPNPADQG